MTGIDGFDLEPLQLCEAGLAGGRVVHDGVDGRLAGVFEQVTAKEIAARCQEPDGAFGMTGQQKDLGIPTEPGEIRVFANMKVRHEPVGSGKPEEERGKASENKVL